MNAVKDMLRAGKTAIGTTGGPSSPVEFLADSGFDFILFDTQHSAVEIKELQNALQAMKGKNTAHSRRFRSGSRRDSFGYRGKGPNYTLWT
ncbi:MAG: hypothetical protein NC923_04855 [Candidatus Omnitrophica bacterium]|nr:hypothetical protein [Candidatus Omnitrophota bacterium]